MQLYVYCNCLHARPGGPCLPPSHASLCPTCQAFAKNGFAHCASKGKAMFLHAGCQKLIDALIVPAETQLFIEGKKQLNGMPYVIIDDIM